MTQARKLEQSSELKAWEYWTGQPDGALKGWVCSYIGYCENPGRPVSRLEVPKNRVILILGFGDRLSIRSVNARTSADQYAAFIADFGANPLITEYEGVQRCIEIELFPWAINTLFGCPPIELTKGCVHLEALWGAATSLLLERLSEMPTWQSRFDLVNQILIAKIAASTSTVPPEIQWAWHQLENQGGCVPIRQLAQTIGWSDRYFAAGFREHVGITPKVAARRIRFNRAVQRLEADNSCSLSDLAASCGYSDQSHFAREFRLFAGCSAKVYQQAQFRDILGISSNIVEV
ncbi:MAG: helix-turn-helix domain-containing protein [Cyanobacteria bacterium J06636_16]